MLSAFPCVSLLSLWQRPVIQRSPSCSRAVFTPSSDFSSDLRLILPLFPETLVPNRVSAQSSFNTSPNIIPKMSQNDCTWKLNVYFKMERRLKTQNFSALLRAYVGVIFDRDALYFLKPIINMSVNTSFTAPLIETEQFPDGTVTPYCSYLGTHYKLSW